MGEQGGGEDSLWFGEGSGGEGSGGEGSGRVGRAGVCGEKEEFSPYFTCEEKTRKIPDTLLWVADLSGSDEDVDDGSEDEDESQDGDDEDFPLVDDTLTEPDAKGAAPLNSAPPSISALQKSNKDDVDSTQDDVDSSKSSEDKKSKKAGGEDSEQDKSPEQEGKKPPSKVHSPHTSPASCCTLSTH